MKTLVFFLMIDLGSYNSPVIVPEPYLSREDCVAAGDAFKASNMDQLESGDYFCIPQTVPSPVPAVEGR